MKLLPQVTRFRGGKAHEQFISETGDYVCVNSKFISSDGKVRKHCFRNFCCARLNDILMVTSDLPNGKALAKAFLADADDRYAVNQRVCSLTTHRDCPQYLFYILNRNPYFLKFDDGVSQTHLLNRVFQKCPIPLPPTLAEQEAIAGALSDADAWIESLEQLIAKKRQIKQGAMQELLTGKRRLPGFSGQWEWKRLGEVATFLSGGTPSRANDHYWKGTIPWISASSLRCFEVCRSDSNVTKEAVAAGSKMAPLGSTLLLVRGSALHNEILCGLVTRLVCFNQDVKALIPAASVVPRFLTTALRAREQDLLGMVTSAGNTAGVLDTKQLKAFEIPVPTSHEQMAITTVLSDMDTEIESLESKLAKAREIKQGMMQELLTGRIRLIEN